MASILKIGNSWRAQVRLRGMPSQAKTFPTQRQAQAWARAVEAGHSQQQSNATMAALIDRYETEMTASKPFGRNKADVLARMRTLLGDVQLRDLTVDRIVHYITEQRRIQGVTAGIDLTYMKGVLKIARALWREPVQPSVVDEAREVLRYMGKLERGAMRDRRPTEQELAALREWFKRSDCLTPDIFDFILASCFRPPSEIVRLRWEDVNHKDRTIIIRDRKDPRRKIGNHQIVPLLRGSYDIAMRQPKRSEFIFPVNGHSWSSLFPRACRDLGIKDLRLYDMRHHAISTLVECGKYSIPEICLVTGHKSWQMLSRYTHIKAKDLHR